MEGKFLKYAFLMPLVALVGCAPQPPQIVKALPPSAFETWTPQETVTNVQDWDRVATKIADGLQAGGLLRSPPTVTAGAVAGAIAFDQALVASQPHGHAFSANYDRNSMFLRQVDGALENEIIGRGGTTGDMHVDLAVGIVPWGSRLDSHPYTPRYEGVWQAKVQVGDKVMSFREPFYMLASDLGLYVQLPASPSSPDQVLAGTARPLRYTTK